MARPEEHPALAHAEKTLADSYRKEIDQEENVWRSLPFFAATLALQLAALFQVIDKLPEPTTTVGIAAMVLLIIAGASTLVSLGFLAASFYPQKFDYIAKQVAILTYVQDLIRHEQDQGQEGQFNAAETFKTEIARQYARATDHNQQINKLRERRRSIAGLTALGSVLTTVFLVAATYTHYLNVRVDKEHGHARPQSNSPVPLVVAPGDEQNGQQRPPRGPDPAANAGRH